MKPRILAVVLMVFGLFSLGGCGEDLSAIELLAKAQEKLEDGDLEAAQIYLKNALSKDPGLAAARWTLGRIYLRQDRLSYARKEMRKAWELGMRGEPLLADLVLLMAEADEGQKALTILTGEARGIDNCMLDSLRGRVFLEMGKAAAAQRAFELALAKAEDCSLAFQGLALKAFRSGMMDEAHRYIKATKQLDGYLEFERLLLTAKIARARKEFEVAEQVLHQAVSQWPENPQAWLALGWLSMEQEKWETVAKSIESLPRGAEKAYPVARFLRGMLAMKEKHFEEAVDHFRDVASVFDKNPLFQRSFGYLLAVMGETEQAIGYLSRYVARVPADWKYALLLSELLVAAGRPDEALDRLEKILRSGHGNAELAFKFATIATQIGAFERLVSMQDELERRVERKSEESAKLAALLGRARFVLGDKKGAIGEFDIWMSGEGESKGPGLALLRLYLSKGMFKEARDILARLEKRYPGAAFVLNARGFYELAKGNRDAARRMFEDAAKKDPEYLDAQRNLATLEAEEGRIEEAKNRLREILAQQPDDVRSRVQLAGLLKREGNEAASFRLLEEAVTKADKEFVPVTLLLVQQLVSRRQYDEALSRLNAAKEKAGAGLSLRLAEMEVLLRKGDFQRAIEVGKSLVETYPQVPASHVLLAAALVARGKGEEALDVLERAWRKRPERRYLTMMLGLYDQGVGEFPDRQVREWLEKNPGDTGVRARYAAYLMSVAQWSKADIQYRRLLGEQPEDASILNNLAYAKAEQGELEAARKYAERAVAVAPKDPAILDTLGWILARLELFSEAEKKLSLAREQLPGNGLVAFHYAWVIERLGRRDEALHLLDEAMKADPSLVQREEYQVLRSRLSGSGLAPQATTMPAAR